MLAFFLLACLPESSTTRRGPSEAAEDSAPADPVVDDTAAEDTGPCPIHMAPLSLDGATVCMDRYEAPGQPGALPLVMYTFVEAEAWCEARGERLCLDSEWQAACVGAAGTDYPYGDTREPGRCNDEETWITYSQSRLDLWPASASSPDIEDLDALFAAATAAGGGVAADHVADLYQGEGGGDNEGCTNETGVFDLTGNVEEWTRRADGGAESFHGNLKGRYWAEARSCTSNVTAHGDTFRFYEIGFRCCWDPAAPGGSRGRARGL